MNLQIFLKTALNGTAVQYSLPSLAELLSVGRRQWHAVPIDEVLCEKFGISRQSDIPLAAISRLGDGMDEPDAYSLMARPVHLALQRDHFVLYDPAAISLTMDETNALIHSLNAHFHADGLTFICSKNTSDDWYLLVSAPQDLQTTHLARAVGRNINRLLPQGKDASRWSGYLNQVQMLLHEHPVNQAREARGELPINSLWIYGGGKLPASGRTTSRRVLASDSLGKGLALLTHDALEPFPSTAVEVLNSQANALAVVNTVNWQAIEQDWLQPLLHSLKRFHPKDVHLYLEAAGNTLHVHIRPFDLYKFWYKKRPVHAYLDGIA